MLLAWRSDCVQVVAVSLPFALLYGPCYTVAYIDLDRTDTRALCAGLAPYLAVLLVTMLAQSLPVVTLSHLLIPASYRRLAINFAWASIMAALLILMCLSAHSINSQPLCLDHINSTAPFAPTTAFFVLLAHAVLLLAYSIFLFQDARLLLAYPI
jgi:hypothetical protein